MKPTLLAAGILCVPVVVVSMTGCGFFRRLAGNDTINLEKAEVKSMSVDLRRQHKTICPREPVQMAVFADVVLEGEKDAKHLETWQGKEDVNKNDKLDFADFAFNSEQGKFDGSGWFAPNPNLLATAGKEFQIKSVFRKRPDKFSFATTYKPDYTCITQAGGKAAAGQAGHAGSPGSSGRDGSYGGSNSPGGDGGDGGPGTGGAPGTDGAAGPHITAFATMVKTPFYERLVGIVIKGETEDFVLVPEGQAVTLSARGGAGGGGGSGGEGGRGGGGGHGFPGAAGGKGGVGGNGGSGGNGGPGGELQLTFDSRFPELKNQIKVDVRGGDAGAPGKGGSKGNGGMAGNGISPSSQIPARNGQRGPDGTQGAAGTPGRPGPDGKSSVTAGNVKDKFGGLAEVTPL